MSMRVDPTAILPRSQPRHNDPLSHRISEALNHQLLTYAKTNAAFTIPEIRDQLLERPELGSADPTQLRFRVRDRLNRLKKHGVLMEVGVRGKNRRVFRVNIEPPSEPIEDTPSPSSPSSSTHEPPAQEDHTPLLNHLERERHCLQAAMHTAIGEAEHYRDLIEKFPDARAQITSLLEAALEQSGRLRGQWDANVNVRRALASQTMSATVDNTEDLV